jgi:hypothetical protein
MKREWRTAIPWGLSGVVSLLAIYAWGNSLAWNFSGISPYQFFPVLGLLAYSIMWSHYMIGAVKDKLFEGVNLTPYFRYTGYVVLGAIVLHPGILIYQRFRDGFGLPPHSYESYVAPSMAWITLLGTASLLAFLAFELHRWYGKRTWWKYVIAAGDLAMVAIFYHGLQLGSQLHGGWFRVVWWFYGLTLLAALARKYMSLLTHNGHVEQTTDW